MIISPKHTSKAPNTKVYDPVLGLNICRGDSWGPI